MWAINDGQSPKMVPREVSYYYLCSKFKCLPGVGGLLDQDPALVEAFVLCMQTEGEYNEYKEKKAESERKVKEKADKARAGQR